MPQENEAFSLNNPAVIEERNRRIAAHVGKELKYSAEMMQNLFDEICAFKSDRAPRKLAEYLYEKLWLKRPGLRREDTQKIVIKCHEEAFDWFQSTHPDLWDSEAAVKE